MFTGIIKEVGTVSEIASKKDTRVLIIKTKKIHKNKKRGQSISVNGVCLTISNLTKNTISFDIMEETIKLTNLKNFKKGTKVNLESSIKIGEEIDGHIVQGHIDCTSKVIGKTKEGLRFEIPKNTSKYIALKGSIAINGVSLTISHIEEDSFEVCLVKHTIENTNLSKLRKGDLVNIEFDPLIKYLEKLLENKEDETKYEFLKDRGFI